MPQLELVYLYYLLIYDFLLYLELFNPTFILERAMTSTGVGKVLLELVFGGKNLIGPMSKGDP